MNSEMTPERVSEMLVGSMELTGVSLGSRLGCWAAVAAAGDQGINSRELAEICAMNERYAREWLEAMGAGGWLIITVDDPYTRRFGLAPGVATLLVDAESDDYLDPLIRQVTAGQLALRRLEEAFRQGTGIGWGDHDPEVSTAQGEINRNPLRRHLAGWLRSALPEVAQRLDAGGWVADVGCGYGWASIGLAEAFPAIYVDAFDPDEDSALGARAQVDAGELTDRIVVHHTGLGPAAVGPYALMVLVEVLHDVPDPVTLLAACRERLDEDGTILVVDMLVADVYTAPADLTERMMYGFSQLVCLPAAMGVEPTAATGTVMRPSILQSYANAAGLTATDLQIEHDHWRFWALRPFI